MPQAPVLEQLNSIDSTNAELLRRCQAGANQPMAIFAQAQSAGRGRNGKTWEAPARGLYYSQTLCFEGPPRVLIGLSLALGIAAIEAIYAAIANQRQLEAMPTLALKWPNDLWINRQKLGGILIEIASNTSALKSKRITVVAGVGINLAGASGVDRTDLAAHGITLEAKALAGEMLSHWQLAAALFGKQGFAGFHVRWQALDALAGQDVHLTESADTAWRAEGVTLDGALRLQSAAHGERLLSSGEVSLKLMAAPQ
jgi:BirA family transcriptional regulator, biotin operon repressor / biotin---[acetyl-CoA-carboxylase] ligase